MKRNLITINAQFKNAISRVVEQFNDPAMDDIPGIYDLKQCFLDAAQCCLPFVVDRDMLKANLLDELDLRFFHGKKLKGLLDIAPWSAIYLMEDAYCLLDDSDKDVFIEALIYSMHGADESNCDTGYHLSIERIATMALENKNLNAFIKIINFIVEDFIHNPDQLEPIHERLCEALYSITQETPVKKRERGITKEIEKINNIFYEDGGRVFLDDELLIALSDVGMDKAIKFAISNLDFHPKNPGFYVSLAQDYDYTYKKDVINRLIVDNKNGITSAKAEAILVLKIMNKHKDGYDIVFQNINDGVNCPIEVVCKNVITEISDYVYFGEFIPSVISFLETSSFFSTQPDLIMKQLQDTEWYDEICSEIKQNDKLKRHLLMSEIIL